MAPPQVSATDTAQFEQLMATQATMSPAMAGTPDSDSDDEEDEQ
jgi:hypothetical protein